MFEKCPFGTFFRMVLLSVTDCLVLLSEYEREYETFLQGFGY